MLPLPRPSVAVLIPPVLTYPQVLLLWHLLGLPGGSKRGLRQWVFLPRMTHIRNRAQTEVSGKGLAPACLRPGAEAGGKCLEWLVGCWHTGCPRQWGKGQERPDPGLQNASCSGAATNPLALVSSFTKKRTLVGHRFSHSGLWSPGPFRSATGTPQVLDCTFRLVGFSNYHTEPLFPSHMLVFTQITPLSPTD